MSLAKLTATQAQTVDLIVARHRLGEPFWPMSTELYRTYRELEMKGYLEVLDGHVKGTVRVRLTPAAREQEMSGTYKSPLERQVAAHIADSLEMSGADPTTIRMIRKQFVKES